MLLDTTDILKLRDHDLNVGDRTFLRAFDVANRNPVLYQPATRGTEPLYAVPGGQRGTEQEIRQMLQEAR